MTTITPVSSVYTSFVPATVKKPVASDAAAPVSNRFHASEPNALMKALANKYDLSNMDVSQYDAMSGELFGKIPSEQSPTWL